MRISLNHPYTSWIWPLLTAFLLWLAWPPMPLWPLLFVAFIPLLLWEYQAREDGDSRSRYLAHIALGMLAWNALTTWWVGNSTIGGALFMLVLNMCMFTLPFLFHQITWKLTRGRMGYLPLVLYWMGMEYIHHRWDFSWPWLTLGNGLAEASPWLDFYSVTGPMGGTAWIWLVNILVAAAIRSKRWISIWKPAMAFVFPLCLSAVIFFSKPFAEKVAYTEVVIVQPNIDPYLEKFDGIPPLQQVEQMISLAETQITPSTRFVVFPETAVVESVDEAYPMNNASMKRLAAFLQKHPQLTVISGADSYYFFGKDEKPTITARQANKNLYYDAYNAAFSMDTALKPEFYHKSRLVPGVEQMPYPAVFGFLAKMAIDLGGTSGSLGHQDSAQLFRTPHGNIAPVICYESIYGDYVAEFARMGAGAIFVMTNDGWWGNTDGYKQHLQYARLLAIETGLPVIRSANTGISAYINPKGQIEQQTRWWEPAVIRTNIPLRPNSTFFVQYGDLVGTGASIAALLTLLYSISRLFIGRKLPENSCVTKQ